MIDTVWESESAKEIIVFKEIIKKEEKGICPLMFITAFFNMLKSYLIIFKK